MIRDETREGFSARHRYSGNDYARQNHHALRPINRIPHPHSTPPGLMLYLSIESNPRFLESGRPDQSQHKLGK